GVAWSVRAAGPRAAGAPAPAGPRETLRQERMEETDARLVERARRGDADAFGALVRRHLKSAYAVALGQLGEPADAEDACQDAFVTALQRLEECRKPDQFGPWLFSIVRNRARDRRRWRAVRDALPLESAAHVGSRDDPGLDVERLELREDLLDAMRGLTELQREVVLLYDIQGWSHKEIAGKLGISDGSARVHLFNARRALRERLAHGHTEHS
ncbi:MAG: polymerase sigma factor, sigma-70 family, partial [Gemmatimonadetes bacterium]|nr:polymerase sigma factor, sigma-70 family [Gemmatimonadota bacterium]